MKLVNRDRMKFRKKIIVNSFDVRSSFERHRERHCSAAARAHTYKSFLRIPLASFPRASCSVFAARNFTPIRMAGSWVPRPLTTMSTITATTLKTEQKQKNGDFKMGKKTLKKNDESRNGDVYAHFRVCVLRQNIKYKIYLHEEWLGRLFLALQI